jgi:hypothetical protein
MEAGDLVLTGLACLPAVTAALAWLAVALMPEGALKKSFRRSALRFTKAYVFGGLLGALYGTAACPDHFSMQARIRYISVHAIFGAVLWWLGSLAIGSLPKSA